MASSKKTSTPYIPSMILRGSLAGTEALDVDLLAHLLIRLLDGSLKLRRAHLDGQRDLTLFNFFRSFSHSFC